MNLYAVLAFLIGTFALLHLALLPRVRGRYSLAIGVDKVKLGRRVATLDLLRGISLLAILSTVAALGIAAAISFDGGGTSAEVARSLARIQEFREFFETFSSWFGVAATLLIVYALWRLVQQKAGQQTEAALKRAIELELTRVRAERDAGGWAELPATDEMRQIEVRIHELSTLVQAAQDMLATGETRTQDGVELEDIRRVAENEIASLRAQNYAADEHRRLNINWHPPELDAPPPESLGEKIQTFFFSRGMLRSLSGTSKALFVLGILLLIPSLTAIAADPLADKAGAQLARLENLYVALRQEEAKKSWEEAATKSAPPLALTEEDEAALDSLAAAYERGIAQTITRVATLSTAAIPREVGVYRARRAVLQEFARHAPTQNAALRVATAAERIGPLHDDLIALSTDVDAHKPRTPEGLAFRERLRRDVATASAEQWDKFKKAAVSGAASFQRAATAAEIESALISRLVGAASPVDLPDSRMRADVGVDAISSQTRARVFETRSHEFMGALARGDKLEDAIDALGKHPSGRLPYSSAELGAIKTVAERIPKVADVTTHIQNAPPSIVRERVRGVDLAAARKAGEALTTLQYGQVRPVEALHHFDDMFPHHGPGGGHAPAKASGAAVGSFHQSRSFVALRGSRRIGGVLIGRESEKSSPALQFNGVTWSMNQDRVTLRLSRGDGKTVELGPYRSGVVHQALAYAADGRPITVTMTTAHPLAELQIQLHPTLVDTSLGCRAIEVDRFVDRLTATTPDLQRIRQATNELVHGQRELYAFAWAKTVQSEGGMSWIRINHPEIATDIAKRAIAELSNIGEQELRQIAVALKNAPALGDPLQSLLLTKREFFSPLVVRLVHTCVKASSGAWHRYQECVTRESSGISPAEFSSNTAWDAPPPAFQEWSGVRETAYKLDGDLSFASAQPPAGADLVWPLEFIVQLAFTTQPYGVSKKLKWYDDDATIESYEDPNPWQFSLLQRPLQLAVEAAIKRDRAWSDTMEAMREFTVLQRLFRSAFAGGLGSHFPADSLARLAADTGRAGASLHRTARWNARPGAIEQRLLQIISMPAVRDSAGPLAQRAGTCFKKFQALNDIQLARVSLGEWDAVCRFEAEGQVAGSDSAASRVARVSVQTSEARRMRAALRVEEDDRLLLSKQGCGPL